MPEGLLETHIRRGEVPLSVFRTRSRNRSDSPTLLWASGSRALLPAGTADTAGVQLARALATRTSCTVVLAGYRFGREDCFPAGLTDYYNTLEWLQGDEAGEEVSSSAVVLGGDGIGAAVAAAASVVGSRYGMTTPAAQVLLAPLLDARMVSPSCRRHGDDETLTRLRTAFSDGAPGLDPTDPLLSPLLVKDHGLFPPTIIVTAESDPLRDDGERFAQDLRKAGVPVWGHRYPQTTHLEACDGGRSKNGARIVNGIASALAIALSSKTTMR